MRMMSKMNQTISLQQKLSLFSDHWSPKIVAQLNDYHVKLVKVQGEFVWHQHDETDELFMVLDGELTIEMADGEDVVMRAGEIFVVPKGVQHRPIAHNECHILLLEPAGLINTGNADSELTAPNDAWI